MIPTAEEELNEMFRETGFDITNNIQRNMVISSMKLFAKMHVENAKKEYEKIILQEGLVTEAGVAYLDNAYPLTLIK